jgi:hypothetical protein
LKGFRHYIVLIFLARLLEVSGISDQYEDYRKDARTESDILTIIEKGGKL